MKKIYGFIVGIVLLGGVSAHVQAQTGSTYTEEADRWFATI